jgi:hypothetical protein
MKGKYALYNAISSQYRGASYWGNTYSIYQCGVYSSNDGYVWYFYR